MVRTPLHDRAWDVVIVDATDQPADSSLRLQAELLRLDLRVRLEVVPAPSVGDLPPLTEARVSQAAYCVILMTVGEQTACIAVPAPRYPGQDPMFAPLGAKAPPGCVETGRVGEDVAGLAGRIAGRVRAA